MKNRIPLPRRYLHFIGNQSDTLVQMINKNTHRPHMHFAFAPDPLSRSHFVATLTVAPRNQTSVSYLNELLNEVTNMVETEVLDRILLAQ